LDLDTLTADPGGVGPRPIEGAPEKELGVFDDELTVAYIPCNTPLDRPTSPLAGSIAASTRGAFPRFALAAVPLCPGSFDPARLVLIQG